VGVAHGQPRGPRVAEGRGLGVCRDHKPLVEQADRSPALAASSAPRFSRPSRRQGRGGAARQMALVRWSHGLRRTDLELVRGLAAVGAQRPVDPIEDLASEPCVSAAGAVLLMGTDMGPQVGSLGTPPPTAAPGTPTLGRGRSAWSSTPPAMWSRCCPPSPSTTRLTASTSRPQVPTGPTPWAHL